MAKEAGRRGRSQRGAAVVEAALITPIVLLVMLASVELSLLGNAHLSLGTAVAETGREASITRDDTNADRQIFEELRSRLDLGDGDQIRVIIYEPTGPNAPPSTACTNGRRDGSCSIYWSLNPGASAFGCDEATGHCPVERAPRSLLGIEVRIRYRTLTGIFADTITLTRRSVVTVEPPV